ncbi:MAG: hypothetical protein P8Y71_13270 [Pseudolabrys sp.]
MSCNTCHQQGAGNAKLYIPGSSLRPGTFDTTGPLFNLKSDNHVLDAVRVPTLRGARYLMPYGHDGRYGSLRLVICNVIVNEFAGDEPGPQALDALVTYVREIAFLPNPQLDPGGRLSAKASEAARRGEALFNKPFPHDAGLSCGMLSSAFVCVRRSPDARCRHRRLVQDAHAHQCQFQRALFPRRGLRELRRGGRLFRPPFRSSLKRARARRPHRLSRGGRRR